jgi:hypothetical protein
MTKKYFLKIVSGHKMGLSEETGEIWIIGIVQGEKNLH